MPPNATLRVCNTVCQSAFPSTSPSSSSFMTHLTSWLTKLFLDNLEQLKMVPFVGVVIIHGVLSRSLRERGLRRFYQHLYGSN
ncbi:hypothetical protein EGR_01423 [Echinococcus granulosus]|uniref:Uncharacterized protein n=1 Tax=Echinococcus granulosus TaxID=6210 RepID=W6UQ50_ECHGR|nr:hypothetical protein EGR_01423 [Echinococcus granulosus]EUB63800.1 hypothetical protein EGR_01423 [Echinococcus granulosus]